MAFFEVSPTGTTGVEIAAAIAGERARFLSLGVVNTHATTAAIVQIYDGTAAGGTRRFSMTLSAGASWYGIMEAPGKSVIPKPHFTAGNSIEVNLAASGTCRIFGDVVREV